MSCIKIGSSSNERTIKKTDGGRKKKNSLVVTMVWRMRGRLRIYQRAVGNEECPADRGGDKNREKLLFFLFTP
jgi:hypothetical protein